MIDPSSLVAYATAGPPEHALVAIRRLRKLADDCEPLRVADARAAGWSWGEIARVLGRSRQAVHRRYRDLDRALPPSAPLTHAELQYEQRHLLERKIKGEIDGAAYMR